MAESRKRWWTALAGTLVFLVLGAALVPLLISRAPSPRQEGDSIGAPPSQRARDFTVAAVAGETSVTSQDVEADAGSEVFDCMILPSEVIEVGSAVTGLIETFHVERSDYVEVGSLLVSLESSVEAAAVRVAQARAERNAEVAASQASRSLSEQRLARARDLFERDSLSLDIREETETQANVAAREVDRARENLRIAALQHDQVLAGLELRTIRSPVSGYVVDRMMSPGELVDEDPMLRIAQVDPLRIEVILPSRLFHEVRPGARAEIVPEAPLDEPRNAEVTIVDPVIDGASGTFGARLLLPNPGREIPAGLRCRVSFVADPKPQG